MNRSEELQFERKGVRRVRCRSSVSMMTPANVPVWSKAVKQAFLDVPVVAGAEATTEFQDKGVWDRLS